MSTFNPASEQQAFKAWFDSWVDPNIGAVETAIKRQAAWAAWVVRATSPTEHKVIGWLPNWAVGRLDGSIGAVADPVVWGINTCIYSRKTECSTPVYVIAPTIHKPVRPPHEVLTDPVSIHGAFEADDTVSPGKS